MTIIIVGDQVDRLEILRQLLDGEDDWEIRTFSIEGMENAEFADAIDQSKIAILDLAYVSEPAPLFINKFKEQYSDTCILGIHFYKNRKLIEPLIEAGIDGYIHSNCRKSVMYDAIRQVSEGRKYISG